MGRKALKDFTFSDGTFIPKGTYLAAVAGPVHMDEKIYEDPLTFKPFRFAEAREGADDARDAVKNQMITTSLEYLPFGHGKHAWWVPHIYSWRFHSTFTEYSCGDVLT
jgi:cytochrome P450